MATNKHRQPRRTPRVRSKKSAGGGLLMGMRTGFRRVTGAAHASKAARTTSGIRRGIAIGVGVVLVIALVWGLAR